MADAAGPLASCWCVDASFPPDLLARVPEAQRGRTCICAACAASAQGLGVTRIEPPDVYVADTGTAKGRGAFAARPFRAGELVEACPVVPFDLGNGRLPQGIERIMFGWGYLIGEAGPQAIVLGYGSIYNHDNPANMRYQADAGEQVLRFLAVRDIDVDEGLTVNYNAHGGGAEWADDAWFRRMKIEPIVGS